MSLFDALPAPPPSTPTTRPRAREECGPAQLDPRRRSARAPPEPPRLRADAGAFAAVLRPRLAWRLPCCAGDGAHRCVMSVTCAVACVAHPAGASERSRAAGAPRRRTGKQAAQISPRRGCGLLCAAHARRPHTASRRVAHRREWPAHPRREGARCPALAEQKPRKSPGIAALFLPRAPCGARLRALGGGCCAMHCIGSSCMTIRHHVAPRACLGASKGGLAG